MTQPALGAGKKMGGKKWVILLPIIPSKSKTIEAEEWGQKNGFKDHDSAAFILLPIITQHEDALFRPHPSS